MLKGRVTFLVLSVVIMGAVLGGYFTYIAPTEDRPVTGLGECMECHAGVLPDDSFMEHVPVASGETRDCLTCHTTHGPNEGSDLVAEPVELCLSCHAGIEDGFSPEGLHFGFGGDCMSCHEPHATYVEEPAVLLVDEPYDLCFTCHSGFVEAENHFVGMNCLQCHAGDVHGGME